MNKLRLGLIYFQSKSEIEKNLLNILCAPSHEIPLEDHVISILSELKTADKASLKNEKSLIFIRKLDSLKTWEDIIKLLLIAHRAILEDSPVFLNEFVLHQFKNIQDLPSNAKDTKTRARCNLTLHYYNYVRTYGENYFSITEALRLSKKGSKTPLINSKTLKEIDALKLVLSIALKTEVILTTSLSMLEIATIKELGRLILIDGVGMYEALNAYVQATIPHIFGQNEDTALKLDEHYCDLIKLTEKMKTLYQMKHNFNESEIITAPKLYKFDREFNQIEELYIYEARKRSKQQEIQQSLSLSTYRSNRDYSVKLHSDNMAAYTKRNSSHDSLRPTKTVSTKQNFQMRGSSPDIHLMNKISNSKYSLKKQNYENLLQYAKHVKEDDLFELIEDSEAIENKTTGKKITPIISLQSIHLSAKKKLEKLNILSGAQTIPKVLMNSARKYQQG